MSPSGSARAASFMRRAATASTGSWRKRSRPSYETVGAAWFASTSPNHAAESASYQQERRGAGNIPASEARSASRNPTGQREVPIVTRRDRRTWLLSACALVAGFALLAAACGGGGNEETAGGGTTTGGAPGGGESQQKTFPNF